MRIVSGGQTGADRAALDAALDHGIEAGGWCPRGRLAEDGPIDGRYPLKETTHGRYSQRTEWNVRDSDGTLIVARKPLSGGTALTERLAASAGKPCLVVHPDETPGAVAAARDWIAGNRIAVLNVAGPRQSSAATSYADTRRVLDALFNVLHSFSRSSLR